MQWSTNCMYNSYGVLYVASWEVEHRYVTVDAYMRHSIGSLLVRVIGLVQTTPSPEWISNISFEEKNIPICGTCKILAILSRPQCVKSEIYFFKANVFRITVPYTLVSDRHTYIRTHRQTDADRCGPEDQNCLRKKSAPAESDLYYR